MRQLAIFVISLVLAGSDSKAVEIHEKNREEEGYLDEVLATVSPKDGMNDPNPQQDQVILRLESPLPMRVSPELPGDATYTLAPGSTVMVARNAYACQGTFDVPILIVYDRDAATRPEGFSQKMFCVPSTVLEDSDIANEASGAKIYKRRRAPEYCILPGQPKPVVVGMITGGQYILADLRKSDVRIRVVDERINPVTQEIELIIEYGEIGTRKEAARPKRYLMDPSWMSVFRPCISAIARPVADRSHDAQNFYPPDQKTADAEAYRRHLAEIEAEKNRAEELENSLTRATTPLSIYLFKHSYGYKNIKISTDWYNGKPYRLNPLVDMRDPRDANGNVARLYVPRDRCKAGVLQFGNTFCYVYANGVGRRGAPKISGYRRDGSKCYYGAENQENGALPINPPAEYRTVKNSTRTQTNSYGKLAVTHLVIPPHSPVINTDGKHRGALLVHSGREVNGSIERRPTLGCIRIDPACQAEYNAWQNEHYGETRLIPKEISLNYGPALNEQVLLREFLKDEVVANIK